MPIGQNFFNKRIKLSFNDTGMIDINIPPAITNAFDAFSIYIFLSKI